VIVIEDLHVKGMQQNRSLALSIKDAGLGELRRQLVYKSEWYGSRLVAADRFYPSSKICSNCGLVKERAQTQSARLRLRELRPLARSGRERRDQSSPPWSDRSCRRAWDRSPTGGSPGSNACRRGRLWLYAPAWSETGLVEAGSDSVRHSPPDSRKYVERCAGTGLEARSGIPLKIRIPEPAR
jgi:hypothetical protein